MDWKPGECNANPPGSHPETVSVGVTVVNDAGVRREVKEVQYKDWDGRCRVCFPEKEKK